MIHCLFVWIVFLTVWSISVATKILIFFQNRKDIPNPWPLFSLGNLFDLAMAGVVAVLVSVFYFLFKNNKRWAWSLILFLEWAVIAFVFGDFLFYQYSGTHLSSEHWSYIQPKNLFYIRSSIADQLLSKNFLVLILPIFGTVLQKRIFFKKGMPVWVALNLVVLVLAVIGINYVANTRQAGLIMHKSGLGRNPIIYNVGLFFEQANAQLIPPSTEVVQKLQKSHFSGRKWEALSPEYPWSKKRKGLSTCSPSGKNLIFIFLESFSALSTTPLSPFFHKTTPEFEKLTQEGALFTRTFINGIPTAPALVSTLCSIHDTNDILKNRADLNMRCGAEILRDHGYQTGYLVDADIEYDNMKNFFGQNGFQELIGDDQFQTPAKTQSVVGQFGKHNDSELFQEALQWIDHHSEKPFFLNLVTTTNHDPFPQYGEPFFSKEGEGKRQMLHGTMKYVDHALGNFIRELKSKNYYQNTIVFIFADHPSWFSDHAPGMDNIVLNSWIPLLILNPVGLQPGKSYSQIASHVDFIPTALDMLGVCDNQAFAGHSLMDRTIDDSRRFALVRAGHFERTAWVQGHYFVSLNERTGESEIFDIAKFPEKVTSITQPTVAESSFKNEMIRLIKDHVEANSWLVKTNHIWNNLLK